MQVHQTSVHCCATRAQQDAVSSALCTNHGTQLHDNRRTLRTVHAPRADDDASMHEGKTRANQCDVPCPINAQENLHEASVMLRCHATTAMTDAATTSQHQ